MRCDVKPGALISRPLSNTMRTLHRRVANVGARNSRRDALREIARHSEEQGSIGFQPESGSELKPGGIPTASRTALRAILGSPRLDRFSCHLLRSASRSRAWE